jgi:hypothetical protein
MYLFLTWNGEYIACIVWNVYVYSIHGIVSTVHNMYIFRTFSSKKIIRRFSVHGTAITVYIPYNVHSSVIILYIYMFRTWNGKYITCLYMRTLIGK